MLPLFGLYTTLAVAQQLDNQHPYFLRAVLIDKIAPYVYWHTSAFDSLSTPINLCLVESKRESIEQILPYFNMLNDQQVDERSYVVIDLSDWAKMAQKLPSNCHIFYFADLTPEHVQLLVKKARQASILTIADSLEELKQGAMLGFIEEQGKIKIYFNSRSVNASRLKIKSSLLRIAKKI